jgi:hypothetical protein
MGYVGQNVMAITKMRFVGPAFNVLTIRLWQRGIAKALCFS